MIEHIKKFDTIENAFWRIRVYFGKYPVSMYRTKAELTFKGGWQVTFKREDKPILQLVMAQC